MAEQHSEKVTFVGADGESRLAARLDLPASKPRAFALFAHCFTCTKDIFAAGRIASTLTRHGIAVLRFDFTGLGHSEGEFANTNFSSNVGDLIAAAGSVPEAAAVCTIAAPAEPAHVSHLFQGSVDEIERQGEAEVLLAGRPFRVRKQFLDDIEGHKLDKGIATMRKALLVFHGPLDTTVGIDNASRIFTAAKHPKSFVSLDDADHLLSKREDAVYVADVIAAWAERYVGAPEPAAVPELTAPPDAVVVAETGTGKFANIVSVGGKHTVLADEPVTVGGTDTGPGPYDLLLAGLGACTSMTMRMYADLKGIPLERASVTMRHGKIHATDCEDCETREGKIDRIDREIEITGPLDDAARAKLLEIADKCPVHRTLHSEVKIDTRLKA